MPSPSLIEIERIGITQQEKLEAGFQEGQWIGVVFEDLESNDPIKMSRQLGLQLGKWLTGHRHFWKISTP